MKALIVEAFREGAPEPFTPTRDQKIGAAVRALRARHSMSQHDLAGRMKEADCRWAQATVWSVEAGERPLRLSEASVLAEIFGVPVGSLAGEDGQPSIPGVVIEDVARTIRTLQEAIEAVRAWDPAVR